MRYITGFFLFVIGASIGLKLPDPDSPADALARWKRS